jgi:nucleosome binding factor SPN SPT16 subunit
MNQLIDQLEKFIDDSNPISHSEISNQIDAMLLKNAKQIKNLNLNPDKLDFCFPALIQSGGTYDLRPQAESNHSNLQSDIIIAGVSMKYCYYCTSVVRTLYINPIEVIKI